MPRPTRPLAAIAVLLAGCFGVDVALRAFVRPAGSAAPGPASATRATTAPVFRYGQNFVRTAVGPSRGGGSGRLTLVPAPGASFFPLPHGAWAAVARGGQSVGVGDARGGRLNFVSDPLAPEAAGKGEPGPEPDGSAGGRAARSAELGLIFVPCGAGGVVAFDERSLRRTFRASGAPADQVAEVGGMVVAARGDRVSGLAGESGTVRWTHTAAGPIERALATWADPPTVVMVVKEDVASKRAARLVALDPETGTERWARELPAGRPGAPGVGGGRVVVVSDAGDPAETAAVATDVRTGAALWAARIATLRLPELNRAAAPAVDAGRVYVSVDDGVHCLDAATGARRWAWTAPPPPPLPAGSGLVFKGDDFQPTRAGLGPAAVEGGRLFVNHGWTAFELDAETGREVWAAGLGRARASGGGRGAPGMAPVRDGDTLYVFGAGSFAALRRRRLPAAVNAPFSSTPSSVPASWKRAFTRLAQAAASCGLRSVAAWAVVTLRSSASVPLERSDWSWKASKRPPDTLPPMPKSTRPPPMRMARDR